MARNFIPLVPSGTINADASVAQLEQDVLAMDSKVGELAEDIGDTEQEIVQLKSQIEDVEEVIEDFGDTYAKIDGSYDTMTVGNAKQLVATVGVEDKVPYLFRTTGGSADVGDRKEMTIVGGSIAWNQLAPSLSSFDGQNATIAVSDGVATLTASGSVAYVGLAVSGSSVTPPIGGHKYLMTAKVNGPNNSQISFAFGNSVVLYGYAAGDVWKEISGILTQVSTTGQYIQLRVFASFAAADVVSIKDIMVIDLTQMFGPAIADYIYALEQANAGAGVAWFRKLFPNPYYAYNVGTLMSVKTSANITTGFNQFNLADFATKYPDYCTMDGDVLNVTPDGVLFSTGCEVDIPCDVSGGGYLTCEAKCGTGVNVRIRYVYENGSVGETSGTSSTTWTTLSTEIPARRIIAIRLNWSQAGTFSLRNMCVNLHWDGERDGEYEPYVAHEYALDSDLELRGMPKLDADNSLYYDGDTYEADGTVTRKYGIVDLGTLNWDRYSFSGNYVFYANIADRVSKGMCINAMYPHTTETAVSTMTDDTFGDAFNSTYIYIKDDSYTTAAAFKTAMSGVYLVYELATPTTETADPYQTPQIVDDFGTEEFVDARDVPIPVGHNTMYQANLRAKLEMAPDSPSGDGDYIVRHSNGQNAYVPITFPADKLPAAPTEDGSYVLKVTVASGSATYTWEAQS